MLKEQEVLLDAAKEESKKLEHQAEENAKVTNELRYLDDIPILFLAVILRKEG